jgi:hypothetical protein
MERGGTYRELGLPRPLVREGEERYHRIEYISQVGGGGQWQTVSS